MFLIIFRKKTQVAWPAWHSGMIKFSSIFLINLAWKGFEIVSSVVIFLVARLGNLDNFTSVETLAAFEHIFTALVILSFFIGVIYAYLYAQLAGYLEPSAPAFTKCQYLVLLVGDNITSLGLILSLVVILIAFPKHGPEKDKTYTLILVIPVLGIHLLHAVYALYVVFFVLKCYDHEIAKAQFENEFLASPIDIAN